jgi:hypothetical protein
MAKTANNPSILEAVTVAEALAVLRRDYWDDVRGVVEELQRAVKDGAIANEEELWAYLDETTDYHQRVIYTFQARWGLLCTDNCDAYQDEMGEPPLTPEAAMCMAMRADVRGLLDVDELFSDADGEDA